MFVLKKNEIINEIILAVKKNEVGEFNYNLSAAVARFEQMPLEADEEYAEEHGLDVGDYTVAAYIEFNSTTGDYFIAVDTGAMAEDTYNIIEFAEKFGYEA